MPKSVRTPDARFQNLEGYPFQPNYLTVGDGLRMHYVDEGDRGKPVVLLLHGEPSWSYLYRQMIPGLVDRFRVIAPDLIGFGKSDKLTEQAAYSYQRHIDWVSELIEQLDLRDVTLFCQDWGGLIGLRIVTEMGDRFARVVASNTTLPTANMPVSKMFESWKTFSRESPDFVIGNVIDMGTATSLSDEVKAGYDAPFPSEEYKAGARIFPSLVPMGASSLESDNNIKAWELLKAWEKPFLTLFGDQDHITGGAERAMQQLIPGALGQYHKLLNAGHFIQEDKGEELAALILEFYEATSSQ